LEVEKKGLLEDINDLREKLDDMSNRSSQTSALEMQKRSGLQNRIVQLTEEVELVKNQQQKQVDDLSSKLEHEKQMREVEKEMAIKLNAVCSLLGGHRCKHFLG
jgi:hypothetical protein